MLKERIDEYKEKMSGKLPDEAKKVMVENTKAVTASFEKRKIPLIGDQLPDFELPDQNGNNTSLTELTNGQSLVVTFFRGDW